MKISYNDPLTFVEFTPENPADELRLTRMALAASWRTGSVTAAQKFDDEGRLRTSRLTIHMDR
jgi:hypothetical protein